jgi:hypothetical protein
MSLGPISSQVHDFPSITHIIFHNRGFGKSAAYIGKIEEEVTLYFTDYPAAYLHARPHINQIGDLRLMGKEDFYWSLTIHTVIWPSGFPFFASHT